MDSAFSMSVVVLLMIKMLHLALGLTNGVVEDLTIESMDDLDHWFWICPDFKDRVRNGCRHVGSCYENCGRYIEMPTAKDPLVTEEEGLMCACDALCTVYDDCCDDFKEMCPSEFRYFKEHYSDLPDYEIECVDTFFPAIKGCPGLSDKEKGLLSNDPRDPLVTSKHNGLQFRGLGTFLMCSHISHHRSIHETMADSLIQWNKSLSYEHSASGDAAINELHDFLFRNGKLTTGYLQNIPPSNIGVRLCKPKIVVDCFHEVVDQECENKRVALVAHLSIVCPSKNTKVEDSHDEGKTTSRYRVQWRSTSPATNTLEACSISATFDGLEKPQIKNNLQFRFIFNFNSVTNVISLDEENDWWRKNEELKKTCQVIGRTANQCDLSTACNQGYVSYESQCVKPTGIILQVTGKRQFLTSLNSTLEYSLVEMNETFDGNILLGHKVTYHETVILSSPLKDDIQLEALATVNTFEIQIGDFHQNYTNPLGEYLRGTNRIHLIVQRMEVCLLLTEWSAMESYSRLLCTELSFEGDYRPHQSNKTSRKEKSISGIRKFKSNDLNNFTTKHPPSATTLMHCCIGVVLVFLIYGLRS